MTDIYYKITIEEITRFEGDKYDKKREVYTQEIVNLDVEAVIIAANKITAQ